MKFRLAMNSASGVGLLVTNVVVAFFMSPILVRELGDRDYGLWEIFLSFFGYLSVLDLGVAPAVTRFAARFRAQNDAEKLNQLMSSTLAFFSGAGFVGLVAMGILALMPQLFSSLQPEQHGAFRAICVLFGANFLVVFLRMVFSAYLFGMQEHYLVNGVDLLSTIARAVVTFYIVTQPSEIKLVWLSAIFAGYNALLLVAMVTLVKFRHALLRIRLRDVSRSMLKELVAFGFKNMTLMVAERIHANSIPILIGFVLGAAHVVFYAFPNRLVIYATSLTNAIVLPAMPFFSALQVDDGTGASSRRAWFLLSRTLQFVGIGIAALVIGLGGPFISRWIGPSYAAEGRWVIVLLGSLLAVQGIGPVATTFLVSRAQHGLPARLALVIALMNIPLAILLGKTYGLAGIAASVLLSRIVMSLAWTILACRALELTFVEHMTKTFLRFVVPFALALGLIVGLNAYAYPDSYLSIVVFAALGGVLYILTAAALATNQVERRAVLRFLGDKLRRA